MIRADTNEFMASTISRIRGDLGDLLSLFQGKYNKVCNAGYSCDYIVLYFYLPPRGTNTSLGYLHSTCDYGAYVNIFGFACNVVTSIISAYVNVTDRGSNVLYCQATLRVFAFDFSCKPYNERVLGFLLLWLPTYRFIIYITFAVTYLTSSPMLTSGQNLLLISDTMLVDLQSLSLQCELATWLFCRSYDASLYFEMCFVYSSRVLC